MARQKVRLSPKLGLTPMPTKYRNTKVNYDGMLFDSKAECKRYQNLLVLQRAGKISELNRQVSFELAPKTMVQGKWKRALTYRADFSYQENGVFIVEDVKGKLTEGYKIKRHLMKTVLGIDIRETK